MDTRGCSGPQVGCDRDRSGVEEKRRILVIMPSVWKHQGGRRWVVGICISGGEALSMCLEMV